MIACPNQMRTYGSYVDERPTSLSPSLDDIQCIIVENIKILLHMNSPLAYLPVRHPSIDEVSNKELHSINTCPDTHNHKCTPI